ncbi:MAG TPA: 3-hydroxyacyl-ACP dehydratase [Flavobacteriaceae bacterium]|nr:3-hydroxyacyl-ACP dehydratase [Flavobacteriaceae bacterium]
MLIDNFSKILEEKIENNQVFTLIKINSEHPLFAGHFPGNPVTPGVLMIQIFKEQAERFSGKNLQLARASNIKFLTVIEPETEAKVRLESEIEINGEQLELSGKAIYEQSVSIKLKLTFKMLTDENS